MQRFTSAIKTDVENDKKFQEQLKSFKAEAEKLENSQALKSARSKFKNIELQSKSYACKFKDSLSDIKNILNEKNVELKKSNYYSKYADQLSSIASDVKKQVPLDAINKSAKILSDNLKTSDNSLRFNVYKSPRNIND